MTHRKGAVVVLAVLSVVLTALVYPELPTTIAVQWAMDGTYTNTMPVFPAAFMLPVLAVGIVLLVDLALWVDPLRENLLEFEESLDTLALVIGGFVIYLHALVIAANLGAIGGPVRFLFVPMAGLIGYTGHFLQRAEQNWFFGIRTPWTLSDEDVWERTHAVAGKWMMAAAVPVALATWFPDHSLALIIGPLFAVSLGATVYSFWLYRQRE